MAEEEEDKMAESFVKNLSDSEMGQFVQASKVIYDYAKVAIELFTGNEVLNRLDQLEESITDWIANFGGYIIKQVDNLTTVVEGIANTKAVAQAKAAGAAIH